MIAVKLYSERQLLGNMRKLYLTGNSPIENKIKALTNKTKSEYLPDRDVGRAIIDRIVGSNNVINDVIHTLRNISLNFDFLIVQEAIHFVDEDFVLDFGILLIGVLNC